jgi:hypothetical protein
MFKQQEENSMARVKQSIDPEMLRRSWQERCTQDNFSPAVLGIGTIRVFGKYGDAPIAFPRIESLAALDTLQPDEQWAIRIAQDVVRAARAAQRPVMATQPPQPGTTPIPVPVREFDPSVENILILSLTRGG